MKLKGLFILGFLLILEAIHAQTDFRPGFIIKQNGDTLKGEIDYRGDILMGKICTFKTTGSESVGYYPADIIGFRFNDSRYFVSKVVGGNHVFLEFLIDGKVKIYYHRDQDGDHYYIDKEGIGLNEIPYKEEIKHSEERDNPNYLSKSIYHIGLLNIYMKDAPNFQSRIASIGKPDRENLIKLTKDYQDIVCKNDACIIYDKKLPTIKLEVEIVSGIANYPKSINSFKKHNFEAGILAHLWMPLANEKLFFKSGILFSSINPETGKIPIYRIPVQIEYVFPRGIFRPKLAYGIVLYSPFIQTTSLSAGFNIKLYKSINMGINYDMEFIPKFFFIPDVFFSHTILAGLLFKL